MATFGEIVYMVLDILKERSDDAYYTEDHIIFLAEKMRALLIERKYNSTRNSSYKEISDENKQQICVNLESYDPIGNGCGGQWLRSVEKIPELLDSSSARISPASDMIWTPLTYIPAERMPFVGYNKWLTDIIYAAKSGDGKLYLRSNNPQFVFLKQVKFEAVFSDAQEASKLSCDADSVGGGCDILNATFPLEAALIPSCVELVVQELIGSRFAPEDKNNNAKDDFSEASVTNQKANTAADKIAQEE